jgi:hypothetical protein
MNLQPLLSFGWKHGRQIEAMASSGTPGGSSVVLDACAAAVPFIKKHWPALNENSLLDDALDTLRAMMAPDSTASPSGRNDPDH